MEKETKEKKNTKSMAWFVTLDALKNNHAISDFFIESKVTPENFFTRLPEIIEEIAEVLQGGASARYIKLAHEIGGENEQNHFHILFVFQKQVTFAAMKRIFACGDLQNVAMKAVHGCAAYIGAAPDYKKSNGTLKGGSVVQIWEFGTPLVAPRQSSDTNEGLMDIKNMIDEGCRSLLPLFHAHFPLMVRNYRGIEKYIELLKVDNPINDIIEEG